MLLPRTDNPRPAIVVAESCGKQPRDELEQIRLGSHCMRLRLLSLRAYDAGGMMLDAAVVEGATTEPLITRMVANADVSYIHVHNAKQGCYAGRIDRT
jgi:hypothetical protein